VRVGPGSSSARGSPAHGPDLPGAIALDASGVNYAGSVPCVALFFLPSNRLLLEPPICCVTSFASHLLLLPVI
jgi:hypothetical protein